MFFFSLKHPCFKDQCLVLNILINKVLLCHDFIEANGFRIFVDVQPPSSPKRKKRKLETLLFPFSLTMLVGQLGSDLKCIYLQCSHCALGPVINVEVVCFFFIGHAFCFGVAHKQKQQHQQDARDHDLQHQQVATDHDLQVLVDHLIPSLWLLK